MDHKETLELLPAYIDQELAISDMLAVERHLENCTQCQCEYEKQNAASLRVKKEAPYFAAPPHLVERVNASLPRETTRPTSLSRWNFNWLNAGAAMAILLAAAWSIGLYLNLPSPQERLTGEIVASHVRSLQVDHLSDVASSDQHTVKPWFNGKLNFSPPVVDLSAQGFPLAGGRMDYLDGHPVAVLIYRHRAHPINLYVWPASGGETAPQAQERQGYHLVRWTAGGMNYWAVSDLAAAELENFADILRTMVH